MAFVSILNCDSGNFETVSSGWGITASNELERDALRKTQGTHSGRFFGLSSGSGWSSEPQNNNSEKRYTFLVGSSTAGRFDFPVTPSGERRFLKFACSYLGANIVNPENWYVVPTLGFSQALQNPETLGKSLQELGNPNALNGFFFNEITAEVSGVVYLVCTENLTFSQFRDQTQGLSIFIDGARTISVPNLTLSGIVSPVTDPLVDNGSIDLTISGGGSLGFNVLWSNGETTEDINNLSSGSYTVTVEDIETKQIVERTFLVTEDIAEPIVVNGVRVNPTSSGGSDGSISLTITGGSGNYTFLWSNGETTKDITGLVAGSYSITVQDAEIDLQGFASFLLEDPSSQVDSNPLILIPKANPIRFVKSQEYNQASNPRNPSNSLYCDLKTFGIRNAFYAQPYLKDDLPSIQFQSNIDELLLEVFDELGTFKKNLNIQKVFDSEESATTINMSIFISNVDGRTSLTFGGDGSIPVGLNPSQGSTVEVKNATDANLDGFYTIQEVTNEAIPRIIINSNEILAGTETGDIVFYLSTQVLNIYQSEIDLRNLENGRYKLKLTGISDLGNVIYNSELLEFKDVYEEDTTVLISYKNNDSFWRVDYNLLSEFKLRILGRFYYENPSSEKSIIQDCDFDDIILRAVPTNSIVLNVMLVPYYMHKIIDIIFDHDLKSVNGLPVTSGNDYKIEKFSDLYSLSSGSIELKQSDYGNEFNDIDSGDIGDIDSQNIIGQNDGLLGY